MTGTPPRGAGLDVAGVAEREPAPEPPSQPDPPAPAPPAAEPQDAGTDPRFDTCGAALDTGYGEYVRGVDPEYDRYRDGDGDGVVCEG
ncbi:excalibur calcium-binding domain-containing protein [Pseudokineococcus sp. 1T1Z-3]|uniref:excalibur calcium-binding domain-containing protein n=1 Tax=Pseudokineococcus sp. 1T1Z-3 TaxID=3132745 RepID=UPI0030ABE266